MNSDVGSAPAKPWQRNSGGVASRPAFLTESGQTNQSTGESSGRNNNVSSAGDGRGENTASLGSDDSRPPARPWEAGNSAGNYNLAGSVSAWGNGNTYGMSNYNSGLGWQGINGGYMNSMSNRYGSNLYGMYRPGYGGMNSLSPYSNFGNYRPYGGGMYNSWGGPTGGFGFGGAPFDSGNPQGGNQGDLLNGALIHPWQALMHSLFDRAGMLYGEVARFALGLLRIKNRKRRNLSSSAAGANMPSAASVSNHPQSSISGSGKDGENKGNTWNNVWSSTEGDTGVHNEPQDA